MRTLIESPLILYTLQARSVSGARLEIRHVLAMVAWITVREAGPSATFFRHTRGSWAGASEDVGRTNTVSG